MARFYEQGVIIESDYHLFWVGIKTSNGHEERIAVDKEVYDGILELQREYWRQEKKESRHTWHLELMSEHDLLRVQGNEGPEQILIESYEQTAITRAICQISETQRRRFLMHYLDELTLEQIATQEGCSNRAISYSLSLAKKNLRELLMDDFDF